jgi:hypothetical protein
MTDETHNVGAEVGRGFSPPNLGAGDKVVVLRE